MAGTRAGKWYFGWNIVAAATLVTLLTVGMRMGIGPFFLPMAEDLGFSRSLLAGIVAAGMLCYGLGMPLAGHLVARWGTRPVLLLGTAIVLASTIWTVHARDPVSFLLAFGVSMSFGLAFTSPVAFTPLLSHWFVRRRGMALFFLSTGSMAGIAVMTPVLTQSIAAAGWQWTLLGFAAVFAVVTIPLALLVVRDEAPADADLLLHRAASQQAAADPAGANSSGANLTAPRGAPGGADSAGVDRARATVLAPTIKFRDALRTAPFWKINLGLFACGFSMNLIGTHGVPMLMDHGFDSTTSSLGIGLIGLVAIFSTLILGRLADILPRRHILSAIYLVRGLGFFALLLVGTHWELYGVSTLGGLAWAGSIALSSAILADVYGVKLVGVLYGLAYLGHQVGATISSWLGGWAYEAFGTHWVSFGSAGVLLLVAAAVSTQLPPRNFILFAPRAAPAR